MPLSGVAENGLNRECCGESGISKEVWLDCSVVIPVFNEADSLLELASRLERVLSGFGSSEVVFVDDGSTDSTSSILKGICRAAPDKFKRLHLRCNRGKSTALQVGFNATRGKIIVTMDGDLQDIPEELPKLLSALTSQDLDAVTGWKRVRRDGYLSKKLPSCLFNWLLRRVSGLSIHDFNSGFKAFRRECLGCLKLYGHMHRFVLVFLSRSGYRVGEVEVEHAARVHGVSKFGVKRFYHGLMDLLTVFFITRYLASPLHFFGLYGVSSIAFSALIGVYYISSHFAGIFLGRPNWLLAEHPLWVLSPVLFLAGLILIFFGLLGELINFRLHRPTDANESVDEAEGFKADSGGEPRP